MCLVYNRDLNIENVRLETNEKFLSGGPGLTPQTNVVIDGHIIDKLPWVLFVIISSFLRTI